MPGNFYMLEKSSFSPNIEKMLFLQIGSKNNIKSFMDWLVRYIVNLPQLSFFSTKLIPFFEEYDIISSSIIIRYLHTIFYVSIFYHVCFLFGRQVVFPPLIKWRYSWDGSIGSNKQQKYYSLLNQSAIHWVSFIQSIIILNLCFRSVFNHRSTDSSPESRIFNATSDNLVICVFALGYFIWDTVICLYYLNILFVLHGIVSAIMFTIGLKPYINYYAPIFLLFELSSPFLNIRWFGIKYLPQSTEKNQDCWKIKISNVFQLINNLLLITSFFLSRIVWGWWNKVNLISDFIRVKDDPRFLLIESLVIIGGNFVLNFLNIVWLLKMITIAKKVLLQHKKS